MIVGALARVLHGTTETTDELDIVPSTKDRNLQRLATLLEDIAPGADVDPAKLAAPEGDVLRLLTTYGRLAIIPDRKEHAATTTSSAPRAANISGRGSDRSSPHPLTWDACSTPFAATATSTSCASSDGPRAAAALGRGLER